MIEDRQVLVGGAIAEKAARQVAPDEPLALREQARFVGRGGDKLDAALTRFGLDVEGRRGLDAGASTGGFTDALLQRGATSVVAVDVGRHQLHERLRSDPRVDSREQTDIRSIAPDDVGGPFDVVVADLSFISVRAVAAALVALLDRTGDLVVLVKPQFEAGRAEVSRGRGVVRDPAVWERAVHDVCVALEDAGAVIMDGMASPLRGGDGNVEFLVHGRRRDGGAVRARDLDEFVAAAVADAEGDTAGGAA